MVQCRGPRQGMCQLRNDQRQQGGAVQRKQHANAYQKTPAPRVAVLFCSCRYCSSASWDRSADTYSAPPVSARLPRRLDMASVKLEWPRNRAPPAPC